MNLTTIPDITAALFSLFVYVSDWDQYGVEDDWRSHVETVKQGKVFRDDCDGFALTAVDLLKEIKIEAWPIVVQGPRIKDYMIHMIVAYKDPRTGQIMALDNEYPGPRTLEKTLSGSGYKIVSRN